MSHTPSPKRADEAIIVAWIRSLNDKAVKLTDHKPQVFEVGSQGTLLVADANTFRSISQFNDVTGLRPGLWRAQHMGDVDASGAVVHWQFHWICPGPLDLDNLQGIAPQPLEPQTAWERLDGLTVNTGKISLFDLDMLQDFIEYTGDERLVIDVCQDPFSERMGHQGVLPGGFFTLAQDGGYTISGRKHDGAIVQLRVRESRKEAPDEDA
ncbi:hypothetical protein EIP86_003929 [Pleurotus ostreatoroseus]|nr:hypothetical protein EIP86_003929 [Pleurotus ostreatoroseus]